jgi:hypothetical protein
MKWPFTSHTVNPWLNEAVQRNLSCSNVRANDDDIVVLSDIDEVIDPKAWPEIESAAREHGIVTLGLHLTFYFFNLFVSAWPGPPDYTYRVFVMTGKYFNNMKMTSDKLRKLGEAGKLVSSVFRLPGKMGFHHSWLGDENFVLNKLQSYSHSPADHAREIYQEDGSVNYASLGEILKQRDSLFGREHKLIVNNEIPLLKSVEDLRGSNFKQFFT